MFNLVIFGAPGSGKGTQSDLLVAKYHLTHISTGDLLRSEIERKTDVGNVAHELISNGNLVPDDLIINLLKTEIEIHKHTSGFIFDGFPRTVAQAEALDEMLKVHHTTIDLMLDLEVEENLLIERLLNRGKTSGRSDDNIEVIEKRLKVYHNVTAPVMEYYKKTNRYAMVSNNTTVEECFQQVLEAINKARG